MRDFLDPYGFKMPEIVGSGGYTFSTEYQTVYDSFVVKPAADIAQQQDIMVRALVAAGVWTTRDYFHIVANNDRVNAAINWINPGTYDLIEVNAPTFTAYRGFIGNGINQYLRVGGYNPAIIGGNYIQNSASVTLYSRTDIANNAYSDGFAGEGGTPAYAWLFMRRLGDDTPFRINDAASMLPANNNSSGFFVGNRIAVNIRAVYRNSVLLGGDGQVSTGVPNAEFFIGARNNAGVPVGFTAREYAAGSAGASLDEAGNSEITNFTNALETYLDYVGAGVIP